MGAMFHSFCSCHLGSCREVLTGIWFARNKITLRDFVLYVCNRHRWLHPLASKKFTTKFSPLLWAVWELSRCGRCTAASREPSAYHILRKLRLLFFLDAVCSIYDYCSALTILFYLAGVTFGPLMGGLCLVDVCREDLYLSGFWHGAFFSQLLHTCIGIHTHEIVTQEHICILKRHSCINTCIHKHIGNYRGHRISPRKYIDSLTRATLRVALYTQQMHLHGITFITWK